MQLKSKSVNAGPAKVYAIEETRVRFKAELLFGESASSDAVRKELTWLDPDSVDAATGELILSVQSFLIKTPTKTILIDTGCGNGRQRPSALWSHMLNTPFLEELKALGVSPEGVDVVICTHLHVDHVGWNVRFDQGRWQATFPNATYIFGAAEHAWWKHEHAIGGPGSSPHQRVAFDECVQPIVDLGRARLVGPDFKLDGLDNLEIRLEPLPGHTLHQSGVHLFGGGRHVLFTADAVHHAVQFAHSDWHGRADTDRQLSHRTVANLIKRYTDTETILLLGHAATLDEYRLVGGKDGVHLVSRSVK